MASQLTSDIALCVLAGGLSTRLGRDKVRLRLGNRTLLVHVRALATPLGLTVRVIRHDLVPRCGPLGGVYTALKSCPQDALLFLACDMPFVRPAWLARMLADYRRHRQPVFTSVEGRAGFPFLLRQEDLAPVTRQILDEHYSLRALARITKARLLEPARRNAWEFFNVNTPQEWEQARARWHDRGRRATPRPKATIH